MADYPQENVGHPNREDSGRFSPVHNHFRKGYNAYLDRSCTPDFVFSALRSGWRRQPDETCLVVFSF